MYNFNSSITQKVEKQNLYLANNMQDSNRILSLDTKIKLGSNKCNKLRVR